MAHNEMTLTKMGKTETLDFKRDHLDVLYYTLERLIFRIGCYHFTNFQSNLNIISDSSHYLVSIVNVE